MNALLATEAKVNRALTVGRRSGVLAQPQKRGGEQIDDFLMRVARRVRCGERLVMMHGGRSVEERCSCYVSAPYSVTGMRGTSWN